MADFQGTGMHIQETKYLRAFRRLMRDHFDRGDLQTIAFDLGINWEELPGETNTIKIQSLILYIGRRGNLAELVALLKEERPQVDWPQPPEPGQQISDEEKIGLTTLRRPLLRAAHNLQSRLYNIVEQGFLTIYCQDESYRHYAVTSTLFNIAHYLGWVEAMRTKTIFFDFGPAASKRKLEAHLQEIESIFSRDTLDRVFMLFRLEQKAIGELLVPAATGDSQIESLGYAAFVSRLGDPEFKRWFSRLEENIERIALNPATHEERLVLLQHALINLIDYLDPDREFYPAELRQKIDRARIKFSPSGRQILKRLDSGQLS